MVVGNKNFTDVTKPSEIVQLLLTDDQLANLDTSGGSSAKQAGKRAANESNGGRDLWNEEGDDFFGHSGPAPGSVAEPVEEDKEVGAPPPAVSTVKKRKGPTGAPRGRRPGSKNKPKDKDNAGPKKADATASKGP